MLWRVSECFLLLPKKSVYSIFMQKQNYIFYLSKGVSSSNLKFCFVGTMFLSKSFINAFRTFSTKLNVDGLCFSRYYKFFKSVVMLCLTLTVCLGEDVKSVTGCQRNFMFIKSINKYAFLNSLWIYIRHVLKRLKRFRMFLNLDNMYHE